MDQVRVSGGTMKVYEALAQAFAAEGVDTVFGLMGDANMHWMTTMGHLEGVTIVSVRHEHCACAMAMGYHLATGKVGIVSPTCGPGFTQTMTALIGAVRGRIPLVVFTGETPLNTQWYLQGVDQAPLAHACGAHYIAAHSPHQVYRAVREAFYIAQVERKPVVLAIPTDLQKSPLPELGAYQPSAALLPPETRIHPDPKQVAAVVDKLASAKCPIIVAGRGVMAADARTEVEELAERSGALLGTTLYAKGMFDHNPFSLGIVGNYARQVGIDMGKRADLVVAFGASLSRFTLDSGKAFPAAEVVQIDAHPTGFSEGMPTADVHVQADAKLAAAAMLEKLRALGKTKAEVRNPALAQRIKDEPADPTEYAIDDGMLDPRRVFEELERVVPTDFDTVSGSAHQAYWHTAMRGSDPSKYHAIRPFGAIGNGLSFAVGAATARKNGRVVLYEGDGGLLMHIQELETVKRQGIKLLIVCINDAGFGAETHRFRAESMDVSSAVFGRPNFEAIAQAFGLRGATITDLGQFKGLMKEYERHDTAELWDVHVTDQIPTPPMARDLVALRAAR